MTTGGLLLILIPLSIPLYLFLGWIVFDNARNAADTIVQTIIEIGKAVLLPDFVRVMIGDDSEGASLFHVGVFLVACFLLTMGEYYLVTRVLFPGLVTE